MYLWERVFLTMGLVFRKARCLILLLLSIVFFYLATQLRSNLSEGSITTLKISTDETVDQLRIMIRERWPSLFEKVTPANFMLFKIVEAREDITIDEQLGEYKLFKRSVISPYALISDHFPEQPSRNKIHIEVHFPSS